MIFIAFIASLIGLFIFNAGTIGFIISAIAAGAIAVTYGGIILLGLLIASRTRRLF